MSVAALKSQLVSGLFADGGAWESDAVETSVELALAGLDVSGLSSPELAEVNLYATRIARETAALEGVMRRAAGLAGGAEDALQTVLSDLMIEHYTNGPTSIGWVLMTNSDLRTYLADAYDSALSVYSSASDISARVMEAYAEATVAIESAGSTASAQSIVEMPGVPVDDWDSESSVPSTIGCLGDVAFQVGVGEIFTLRELRRKRDAVYAEHGVASGRPKSQFVGVDLWEVSFSIQLSRNFTNPEARIEELTAMQEAGEHHPLAVGGRNFGEFTLRSYEETVKRMARGGEIEFAELSLQLREFAVVETISTYRRVSSATTAAPVRARSATSKLSVTWADGSRGR